MYLVYLACIGRRDGGLSRAGGCRPSKPRHDAEGLRDRAPKVEGSSPSGCIWCIWHVLAAVMAAFREPADAGQANRGMMPRVCVTEPRRLKVRALPGVFGCRLSARETRASCPFSLGPSRATPRVARTGGRGLPDRGVVGAATGGCGLEVVAGLPVPREPGCGSKRSQDGEAQRTCREPRPGGPRRTSGERGTGNPVRWTSDQRNCPWGIGGAAARLSPCQRSRPHNAWSVSTRG